MNSSHSSESVTSNQAVRQQKLRDVIKFITSKRLSFQEFVVGALQSEDSEVKLCTTKYLRTHAGDGPSSHGPAVLLSALSDAVDARANPNQKESFAKVMAHRSKGLYIREATHATADPWFRVSASVDLSDNHEGSRFSGRLDEVHSRLNSSMPFTTALLSELVGEDCRSRYERLLRETGDDEHGEEEDHQESEGGGSDQRVEDMGGSDENEGASLNKRELCVVTALSALLQARNKLVNRFQMMMGVSFGLLRVPHQACHILNSCGFSVSTRTASRIMETLSKTAIPRARKLIKDSGNRCVFLFDNINIYIRHAVQSILSSNTAVNLTSRTLFALPSECDEYTAAELGKINRLDRKELGINMLHDDGSLLRTSAVIHTATALLPFLTLDQARSGALKDALRRRIQKATVDKLEPTKTTAIPLKLSNVNEGTVEGTRSVVEATMAELGLNQNEDDALLIAGDLLTVMNLNAARHAGMWETETSEQLNHVYAVAGPWHLLLNWLYLMFHTYGNRGHANALDRVRQALGRGKTELDMKKPQFNEGWRLLQHTWSGRVLAMLRQELQKEGVTTEAWNPSTKDFFAIMERIYDHHMSPAAIEDANKAGDAERATTVLFLRDCVLGWEYDRALRAGDVGRMANVEKILVLAFFGAGQTKYGGLLLDRILEDQKAPNLARTLRAAQLVNISGRPNSWQGADHFQEQLNRRLKMYDYSHATDQAIVRFEDRVSAFLGIGEEILNEIKESFGSSTTARRQRDRIERADVRLIATDSEALKLEAADPKRSNNLPETKQTKNRHKAMAQAEAVWDSIKGGAWSLVKSGAIKDNLAQGYLNLLNGGLDRHRNKVRDVLSRDVDVVSLVQEQTGTITAREDEGEGPEPELGDEQICDAELALGEQGGSRARGIREDSDGELDQDEM